jgi:hypothetical protein
MSDYIDLPLSGLEAPLSEMEELVQDTCHRFAEEVLRPVGPVMDRMSPEETVAPDSPLWSVLEQAQGLGLSVKAMLDMDPRERSRIMLIAAEELAWGEPGLAGMILVSQMPALYSALAGNPDMVDYCEGKLGCWGITEPDHGSDTLDADGSLQAVNGNYGRPNCVARIEDDRIIVNGQKSAWVSGGITAQVCALYCHLEENGETRPGLVAIVPSSAWADNELEDLPDIQYGLWETTTVTSMRSDVMNLPENTSTTRDCVTEEDVREGRAFLQEQDDCEILEQNITSTTMDMVMECKQPESGAIRMTVSMEYSGDTSSGTMKGEMDSPMGKMFMDISMDSRRVGDC